MAESFEGTCHCAAIRFDFTTAIPPSRWRVRACRCSFCRAHGARTTTDAAGSVHFNIADPAILSRYRFGLSTADFLVCTRCGVYVAAVLTTRQGVFATLNVNTIRELQSALQRAEPAVYEGETPLERIARRERAWTPVTGGLPV